MSRSVVFNVVVGTLAFLGACTGSKDSQQPSGKVERMELVQKVSLSGTLRGKRSSYIFPGYSGYVSQLSVKLGDQVKEGTPLVKIAQTVDQPLSQIFPIRAPFTGLVTQVLKNEGEYVNSTTSSSLDNAVLRLDDLSEFWIDADVPEIDIAKIKIGQEARIEPNALSGKLYQGEVREISLSARSSEDRWDRGKVEFPVLIRLTNPDENLKAGMSAVLDIIAAKAEGALVLPHEYVHKRGTDYYLVDLKDEEHVIKVGLTNESHVQILSGVDEGMRVKMIDFTKVGREAQGGGRGRRR